MTSLKSSEIMAFLFFSSKAKSSILARDSWENLVSFIFYVELMLFVLRKTKLANEEFLAVLFNNCCCHPGSKILEIWLFAIIFSIFFYFVRSGEGI